MKKTIDTLAQIWSKQQTASVCDDLQKMTIDVLAACVFGQEFDTLNGKQAKPLSAYNFLVENAFTPLRFVIPYFDYFPLPVNYYLKENAKIFDEYCWSIIESARKNPKDQNSLISLMINNNLSPDEIRDNIGVFFIAGHETTSASLSWIIGLLATHPEIQNKARQEVLSKVLDELTYESLKDLEYIEYIIKETMRLHPPVPAIGQRLIPKDTLIGDWFIPADTMINIDFTTALHDKKLWGDPENFRPERWLPENLTPEQRKSWMPFSYGPRICIGMNFSLTEQRIFLVTMLKEFSQIKMAPNAVLQPSVKEGIFSSPDKELCKVQFIK